MLEISVVRDADVYLPTTSITDSSTLLAFHESIVVSAVSRSVYCIDLSYVL